MSDPYSVRTMQRSAHYESGLMLCSRERLKGQVVVAGLVSFKMRYAPHAFRTGLVEAGTEISLDGRRSQSAARTKHRKRRISRIRE